MPAAVRHVAGYRLAFTVTALTVLISAASVATAAGFAAATTGAAVRQALAPTSILVTAPVSPASGAGAERQVTATLRSASTGLPLTILASSWTQPMNLPAGGPAGPHAQTQVISLPGAASHARLVSGAWPAEDTSGTAAGQGPVRPGAITACVPLASARLLGFRVGQVLSLRGSVSNAPLTVTISCIYRPLAPDGSYWRLSPLAGAAVSRVGGFASYGPLITTTAVMSGGQVPVTSRAWVAIPAVDRISAPDLAALGAHLASAESSLTNSISAVVSGSLPGTLAALATAVAVARSQLLLGVLILLVVASATLVVAIRLLASQRAGEAPLLMARGASRRQLARRGATEAAALAIPAAIAGPWLAVLSLRILNHIGPLASIQLPVHPEVSRDAYALSCLSALACVIALALPSLQAARSFVQARASRGRQLARGLAQRAGIDLILVVAAGLAYWQLRRYGAPITETVQGKLGLDPLLVAAPAIGLLAGAVVALRVIPLL
ncbi:MAG: FtsX-like permease family protein, partial [Streptosporangiaceae bacterium]